MLDLGGFMLDIYFLENTNRSFNDLYLCYCGLEKCVPLYSFGPAVRPNYLIHYVLDGEGYYYVNDNKYKVRKNQGFLIEPNVVTFYQADKDNPWTYLWIGIDGDKAKLYLNSVGLDSEHLIFTHEKDDALKEYVLEKKEAIIQRNDRHVEQINLFMRICPGIWRITEIFLFLFGTGRCNGNFGGSGKPDDLKYSIYSYGYYTVKMENTL